MRIVTALLLAVVSVPFSAHAAGVRFDFVAEAPRYTYRGRMWIDGTQSRLEITEGNHPLFNPNIMILSRKAGLHITVVDHTTRTFFQRDVAASSGPLATARGMGTNTASRWHITKTRERLDDGGDATERHTVRAEYRLDMDVEGEKIDATVKMHAEFDIDPRVRQRAHPWGLQFAAKTGFAKIDDALAARIPDRLPLRQVVTFSRQITGGPVVTETLTITISNVVDETLRDAEFYPPAGYPYREPVFSFGE